MNELIQKAKRLPVDVIKVIRNPLNDEQGGVAPYFLAWLLGVPGSILIVVFLLRGCQ